VIRTAAGKQTARGPAAPGKVWLIGAGPGDPELLTLRAARALREADAIVVDRLVAPAVLEHARPDAEVIEAGKQGGRPCISQERINRLLVDRAQAGQRVARLKVVLKQLRPKCRAAVVLRFTHELSYREIAIHLGVSPQMAKKYVAQALGHCQRRMARLAGSNP